LSTTAEYALRIMIALTESPEESLTSAQIARATGVPGDYTVKVLQMLARAELLEAQRGRGGGFRLLCEPDRTTLLDVVGAIDPVAPPSKCPLGLKAHESRLCPLHQCIEDARVQLENGLRSMTLQKVVDNAPGSALCRPREAELPGPSPISKRKRAPGRNKAGQKMPPVVAPRRAGAAKP